MHAQLNWSVYDETTSTDAPASNSSSGVDITVPPGQRSTLFATNFVPIDWTAVTTAEVYVTIDFKVSGGLTNIGAGTRAVGYGLFNNAGTESFADDNGYFTWLNGRATGSLIELRRRNGDGTSPSLLNPAGTAFNGLGTGTRVFTTGALSDGGNYSIQLHLMARNPGVSFGNTSSTTSGAGIWVSGDEISQTAFTNPDNPPATLLFNQVGFMFYNSTSEDVTLTVNSITGLTPINPPAIATQPAAITFNPGQTGSLTVAATGTAPLGYQWKKDGVDVSGATDATLALSNVTAADAGSYTVTITNAYGTVTSDAAVVTVTTSAIPATIIGHPASLTVDAGQSATFSVSAYGSSPVSYQWKKDGSDIAGATSSSLAIDAATPADAGSYTVALSNSAATVTSDPAVLTVNTAPAITTQPASVTTSVGQDVTFTIEATGSPAPTYQWQRNGVNIAGATSPTLALNDVQLTDTGVYTVRIVNSVGAVTSAPAVLAIPSAMAATSFSPDMGATGVNIDTPLRITFDRTPVPGNTGRIRIHRASDDALVDTLDVGVTPYTRTIGTQSVQFIFHPIIVTGNSAAICPHAGVLSYGETYYVTLEQGAIRDTDGGFFTGVSDPNTWRFTTKAAGPVPDATAVTVAEDGSGDFTTVQGAIDFVPLNNTQRVTITVKKGLYNEIVYIGSAKPFITVRGEDREQTTIAYPNNNNFNTLTGNNRAMFNVAAADFVLETITLHNTTPKGGSQAEAFRANAIRVTVNRVTMKSFQDTFLVNGNNCSAFVTDSYIEGDVDFMWGSGAVYFQRCELKALNAGFYAQVRNGQAGKGHVYVDCRLTGAAELTGFYLARIDPTPGNFPYSQVVFVNCAMGSHVTPVGWQLNNASSSSTVQFWEYMTTDLAGATLDVSSRHPSSKQIDDATAAQYRDPAFVLGGWSPQIAPTIERQPVSMSVVAASTARLSVAANGAPHPTYQWFKDGDPLPGATDSTLVLPNVQTDAIGTYSVNVANDSGTITSDTATLTVTRGEFYGVYLGTLGNGGSFALYIRDNGTGVLLGSTSDGGAIFSRSFAVDANGHANFILTVDPTSGQTEADRIVDFTIDGSGAITGTLGATTALAGSKAPATGISQAYAGYHQLGAGLTGATTHIIIAASGQAYVFVQNQTGVDSGPGSVDAFGRVSATTTGGQSVLALISANGATSLGVVTNAQGAQTAFAGVGDTTASALRLDQFSARSRSTSGEAVSTVGFVITGDAPNEVLIRAVGPTLSTFGVGGVLATPRLDLYRSGTFIASNTGWTSTGNASGITDAAVRAGAFPLPDGSADSAIHLALAPGVYTAIMSGVNGAVGVGLVEIYDLTAGAAGQRLVNLSIRAATGSGDNTLIAGIDIAGNAAKRVLLRAVGPSLAQFGVTDALQRPVLSLYQGNTLIAQNADVCSSADLDAIDNATAEAGAFALTSGSADAALLVNLAPGLYTAQVTSADGGAGVVLMEIYEIP